MLWRGLCKGFKGRTAHFGIQFVRACEPLERYGCLAQSSMPHMVQSLRSSCSSFALRIIPLGIDHVERGSKALRRRHHGWRWPSDWTTDARRTRSQQAQARNERQKQQRRLISSSLMATAVGAQRSTHSPAATGCEATAWRPTRLDSAVAIGKGKSPPSHIVPK